MCAVPRSAVFWSNSTLSSGYSPGLWVMFLEHLYQPLSESLLFSLSTTKFHRKVLRYLSIFSCSFSSTLASHGMVISIRSAVCLSLSTTVMPGRLCSITWSVCMFIFQRIFLLCVSIWLVQPMNIYIGRCMSYFSQRLKWTAPATL